MDLWKIGFVLLIIGVSIPVGYGVYELALADFAWQWSISILLIIAGLVLLLISAIRDKMESEEPEEKY